MTDQISLTFPSMLRKTAEKFGDSDALSFVGEKPMSYHEVLDKINSVTVHLESLGIKSGDRVALLSANMPNWGIAYFAITFMGAIVVPMLPDFISKEIENILIHSGSKAIFVSANLLPKLDNVKADSLEHKIPIEDLSAFNKKGDSKSYEVKENDLAAIIYTSGTTGSSKGVMLSHKNICSNVVACSLLHKVDENDKFLSILPLSHTLENTVGFMLPIMMGACIYYIQKPPSPTILMAALKEIRPTIMLTVPMVIEKIYYQRIRPSLSGSGLMRGLMKIPAMRRTFHKIAGKKLMETFGGNIEFFGIGGAKLNSTVEQFLIEAKFPYAIGYGLTETAPLLAGAVPGKTLLGSTGLAADGVELKINDPDPETGEGEIWARGPNVMLGYYKEPEITAEVLTEDGWFRTGDLGTFDEDQNLFIKGRLKNMILGSSGENIYPEEIEFVINNFKHVVESLVLEKKGKLVAMVHINMEEIEQSYQHLKEEISNFMDEKTKEILKEVKSYVNARVNKFSQIHSVVLQSSPFQKTATQKIKRFLYY
ncbi:AMP-binding protein [Bacteroidota bacterium]